MTFKRFFKKANTKIKFLFAELLNKLFPFIYYFFEIKHTKCIISEISRSAYVVSPLETLRVIEDCIIQKKKGAYMRFGDGDIYLSYGKNDMLQLSAPRLAHEMRDAFALRGAHIIKSLPIHSELFGRESKMYSGNHLNDDRAAKELLSHVYQYYVGYKIYSMAALHYAATYYPATANSFLKKLKESAALFIGNENVSSEIIVRLFGKVPHIKTPAKNAYNKIEAIETEAKYFLEKQQAFGVVVIAMGCSGRPLMKRLYQLNAPVFYFDFGSLLDGICGNITRPWLKENINYDELLKGL